MKKILRVDKRGRVTIPVKVKPASLTPLWVDNSLYLLDSFAVFSNVGFREQDAELIKEIKKYRVKGLPYFIPRSYTSTNRITIPRAVRVSDFWMFEETVFRFKSLNVEVPAYRLTPLKLVVR